MNGLRLAIPSKGALEKPTLDLLSAVGLKVHRPNDRQYVASMPALPAVEVIFQRAADIYTKVHEGSVDIGITGYDVVCEEDKGDGRVIVVYPQLGYGKCALVLAVPDSWVDVVTLEDLAELTLQWKEQNRILRIVTKYKKLTRDWLFAHRIVNFVLVDAKGAMEAAPSMGYADMIADVTSTGTTLRENQLKPIQGGTILDSQTCLIANRSALQSDPAKLAYTQTILELIEGHLTAKKFVSLTANVRGSSIEEVGSKFTQSPQLQDITGLRGPTIAKVYTSGPSDWYAVTVVIPEQKLLPTIAHLRAVGGTDITVFPPSYVFRDVCQSSQRLLALLAQEVAGSCVS
ncbi:MAG: ATP phosphoribosyltransferase [Pseudanabaenaceae cyanobacterium]